MSLSLSAITLFIHRTKRPSLDITVSKIKELECGLTRKEHGNTIKVSLKDL